MIECEEVRSTMTALEVIGGGRQLPPPLASHCASCARCQRYLAEMDRLAREIRMTADIPLPPGLLEHLGGIPRRHRTAVAARTRVLAPALLTAALSLATPLAHGDTALWLASSMTLAGAFVAVAGMARGRLIPD